MRSDAHPEQVNADPRWKIGIVHSSYYEDEVKKLVDGAVKQLKESGVPDDHILIHEVPGCFEIPLVGSALAASKKVDALIALGIIVEGETYHADLIAREAARGVMDVQTTYHVPFAFEVLYVQKLSQAKVRSAGSSNKGGEAARAVLLSLAAIAPHLAKVRGSL